MRNKKISLTALGIARAQVFLSSDPDFGYLVPRQAVDASLWFIEEYTGNNRYERIVNKKLYRYIFSFFERISFPGTTLYYTLRKRFIEEMVRKDITNGVQQIVILAGGFDTLALRLHKEFPQVVFLELDHPETQAIKRKAFNKRTLLAPNYQLIPVDLTKQSPAEVLVGNPYFTPNTRTIVIAEGITMYLTDSEVNQLFESIRKIGSPKGRCIFTYITKQVGRLEKFNLRNRFLDMRLRLIKEPYKWTIEKNKLEYFLKQRNFKLEKIVSYNELQIAFHDTKKLKELARIKGGNICVATIYR